MENGKYFVDRTALRGKNTASIILKTNQWSKTILRWCNYGVILNLKSVIPFVSQMTFESVLLGRLMNETDIRRFIGKTDILLTLHQIIDNNVKSNTFMSWFA